MLNSQSERSEIAEAVPLAAKLVETSMETLEFKPPYPVEPVDPLDVAPDPGPMGQMYIDLREYPQFHDGMTLALANIKQPDGNEQPYDYEQVKQFYVEESQRPDFNVLDFFNNYFETSEPLAVDEASYLAHPGEDIDDYIRRMRPLFIIPKEKNSSFDIALPEDRSVAGVGRFGSQSFLWDGYHMAKGYAADGRWDLVMKIAYNQEYEINRFGHPLNGSAYFLATRPQIDYFPQLVRMIAYEFGPEALVRFLPTLEKDFIGYWMDGYEELSKKPLDGKIYTHRSLIRMPDGSFLNRYWDDLDTPRLESYKEDVETAKRAEEKFVALGGLRKVFSQRKVWRDLRAGAASGWDYSSRWFKDGSTIETINTTDIAPIDLNSIMAYHAETLAMAYQAQAEKQTDPEEKRASFEKAAFYQGWYDQRVAAINKYHWDPVDKIYRDHNFVEGYQTKIVSAAMVYPLYVGITNAEQAFGVMEAFERDLLYKGGVIATTTEDSNEQWDGGKRDGTRSKNVWAPFNWAAMRGFARMAHRLAVQQGYSAEQVEPLLKMAEKIQKAYTEGGIEAAYATLRTIPEKHRGDDPTRLANGGEYAIVKLLAMSLETYVAMKVRNIRNTEEYAANAEIAARRGIGGWVLRQSLN